MNLPDSSPTRGSATLVGSNASAVAKSHNISLWIGAVIIGGLWLLARPYIGVRHDGVLYMGQTLMQLQPDALSHDLFFAYGSQDKFSIFSRITAALYQAFGMARAQQIVLAACHAALLVAVAFLLRPLHVPLERWLGLAAVAVMSHAYGGLGSLSFAENFVTARTLAEPLSILAIVMCLSGRRLFTVGIMATALVVHPLIAFPASIVCWQLLCARDARWRWAVLLIGVPIALAIAGVSPFAGLFQRFDPDWRALVEETNALVFVSKWGVIDWQGVVMDGVILFACARLLPEFLATLSRITLRTAIALALTSFVGADLLGSVLITGLQLWRGVWLMHLLAMACLPALLLRLWRAGESGKLCAIAAALAAVATNALWPAAWALQVWAAMTAWLWATNRSLSPPVIRAAIGVTGSAIAALTIAVGARTAAELLDAGALLDWQMRLWMAFTSPALALPVVFGLLWAAQRHGAMQVVAVMLGVVLVTVGAATWDRRSAWIEYVETAVPGQHPFARLIPPRAQVYWPDELAATWLMLSRPSFFTTYQGAGLLFSRATAMEFGRRRPALAPLAMQREICSILAALNGDRAARNDCVPKQEVIDDLCRFPRGPDYLVLPYRLPNGVIAEWTFDRAPQHKAYYLYDCIKLR
jgi:hypothetical protein